MDFVSTIVTIISTIITIISTIIAVRAKNETKNILAEIKVTTIKIKNSGNNTGTMVGYNSGEVKNNVK